jgi:hypothetical protein
VSRTTSHSRSTPAVFAALLLGTVVPASGQDAANPASPSAAKSSPSPTSAAGDTSQSAGDTATADGAAQTSNSAKPAPVCFKLTGRCVEPASKTAKGSAAGAQGAATKDAPTAAQRAATGKAKGPLNLSAPDVRSVVPADELSEPLPNDEQITEVQEAGTVSVKGDKELAEVPLGFGALWWALNHPSHAWRILLPVE